MAKGKRFAIIGAGIGGLTLAAALQQKNIQVDIFEQASVIKPLGAGLGLAANAVKAFKEIGIHEDVLKAGKILKKISIKDKSGRLLTAMDSETLSRKFGVTGNFTIHRPDLHDVLLRHINPLSLQLDKQCVDFKQQCDGVQLFFKDGTTSFADYVIACDGIHSVFRIKLVPQSNLRYAGYTCWRAVINNLPSGLNLDETSETWARGRRFGIVPLANNRVYWFACLNSPPKDSAKKNYTVSDLLSHFDSFHEPVVSILRNTTNDQLIWGDIIDFKPLSRFAFDNIVLMGDAAHATTPNMGQGACMSIEDAVVLSNLVTSHSPMNEAFKKFEALRLVRTEKIVNDSWRLGVIAQLDNPILEWLRNVALRLTPRAVADRQMKFLSDVTFS